MNLKKFIANHKILTVSCCIVFVTLIISVIMVAEYLKKPSAIINASRSSAFYDKVNYAPKWEPDKHQYSFDNLKEQFQRKEYYDENGNLISKFGIDISYHQKDIDWELLKEENLDYIILRMGYRGCETGNLFTDKKFDEYYKAAKEIGLDVGVYFFSQSLNVAEAVEEAEYVIDVLSKYDITYPVAYDWEPVFDEGSRTIDDLHPEMSEACFAFCTKLQEAGYFPIVYANRSQLMNQYDLHKIRNFDLWLAEYDDLPEYPYQFTMWQYSCDGIIKGVSEQVDLNISFVDYSANNQ